MNNSQEQLRSNAIENARGRTSRTRTNAFKTNKCEGDNKYEVINMAQLESLGTFFSKNEYLYVVYGYSRDHKCVSAKTPFIFEKVIGTVGDPFVTCV